MNSMNKMYIKTMQMVRTVWLLTHYIKNPVFVSIPSAILTSFKYQMGGVVSTDPQYVTEWTSCRLFLQPGGINIAAPFQAGINTLTCISSEIHKLARRTLTLG